MPTWQVTAGFECDHPVANKLRQKGVPERWCDGFGQLVGLDSLQGAVVGMFVRNFPGQQRTPVLPGGFSDPMITGNDATAVVDKPVDVFGRQVPVIVETAD